MKWICSECTYENLPNGNICVMCEQGYRLFSSDSNSNESFNCENEVQSNEQDSLLMSNDEDQSSSQQEDLLDSTDETEFEEEDSLLDTSHKKKDIYVRDDGELLFDQQAADERKRSIAKRKALDLQKLLENSSDKSDPKKNKSSSTFSQHILEASSAGVSTVAFASKSKGHFNALTAHAKGANASATAIAEGAAISTGNAYATGANASASASATGVRVNALNATATGINASASATADGLNVAVGNVNATGAEVAASASASAAKVAVGNVDLTGASAGASLTVNGTGITAGNVAIGGPSAGVSATIDGSLSFGNVNLGLRPSFDIGLGFNFGIPFLSGSRMGSSGGKANNNDGSSGGNENPRGLEGLQQYLSEKYPNRRYYAKAAEVSIEPNKSGEPIDPLLSNERLKRTNDDNPAVENSVNRHNELVEDGDKFVGFKGGPRRDGSSTEQSTTPSNNASGDHNSGSTTGTRSTEENIWSGMYASPSPEVAAGYALDDKGRPGVIDRVYLPKDAADVYYTKTGLETREGREALKQVKTHSNNRYIFSGPQSSTDPDLFPPETVIAPTVRDEALNNGSIKFEPSAHQIDWNSYRLENVHERELQCSQIIPDYMVNITKDATDCARDGGRERLSHVFQGRPPYGYENVPPKKKELSEDDKLLLEECRKLGFEIPSDSLDDWKKKLKSDEEYEREEDARNRQQQTNNTGDNTNSTEKQEEETETEPPKPCKDHPNNVRCMKCINGSSGPRIRRFKGQIHGFDFNK